MHKLLTTILVLLVAVPAVATESDGMKFFNLTDSGSTSQYVDRDLVTYTHDFSVNPSNVYATWTILDDWGVMPLGASIEGFGVSGFVGEVFHNDGASQSNNAYDISFGYTRWDPAGYIVMLVTSPWSDQPAGPGVFTQTADKYWTGDELRAYNEDWTVPPVGESFEFRSIDLVEDFTGLPAAYIYEGVLLVEMLMPVTGTVSNSIGAIKALY